MQTPPRGVGFVLLAVFTFALCSAAPAYLARGRRGDWNGFVQWMTKGAAVLLALVSLGIVRQHMRDGVERPETRHSLDDVKAGRVELHTFLSEVRDANPIDFDTDLVKFAPALLQQAYRSVFPDLDITDVKPPKVNSSADYFRLAIQYSGAATVEGAKQSFTGELVAFYHVAGIAVIEGWCWQNATDCIRMSERLLQTETSIQRNLHASGAQGILPEGGECAVGASSTPDYPATAHVCEYEKGITLSFGRRGREEALTHIEAMISRSPKVGEEFSK